KTQRQPNAVLSVQVSPVIKPATEPHSRYGSCSGWCTPMGRRIAHRNLGIAPRRPALEPNQLADHRCEHSSGWRYSFLKIGLVRPSLHPQRLSSLKQTVHSHRLSSLKRTVYSLLKIH